MIQVKNRQAIDISTKFILKPGVKASNIMIDMKGKNSRTGTIRANSQLKPMVKSNGIQF